VKHAYLKYVLLPKSEHKQALFEERRKNLKNIFEQKTRNCLHDQLAELEADEMTKQETDRELI